MAIIKKEEYREFIKALLHDVDIAQIRKIVMDTLTGLWSHLQKERKLPRGVLTATCEAELKDLMEQIDNIMEAKRENWEKTVYDLETKMKVKDKENHLQKVSLDEKCKEVGMLKLKLQNLEQNQKDDMKQYETTLSTLNGEVQKMKKDYDKLQRKQQKHSKDLDKQESNEIIRLKEKLEDYRCKAKDWHLQKRTLQTQIDTLDHQRKALSEKCELIQNQAQTYESQVGKRRDMLEEVEGRYKSTVAQLETQLKNSTETMALQESKIEKLKNSLEEAMNSHRKGMDDNERLLDDLMKANTTVKKMEEEKCKMEGDLKSKEDLIRAVSEDSNNYREDMKDLERALEDKDDIISSARSKSLALGRRKVVEYLSSLDDVNRSLGDSRNQQESEQVRSLRESLAVAKEEIRIYKKNEKRPKEEVAKLHKNLKKVIADYENASEELEKMKTERDQLESGEIKSLKLEILRLQDRLQSAEENYKAEIEGMNTQVKSLTSELHSKDNTMATMSHQTSSIETKMREETEMKSKHLAELEVASTQIEALRLENRRLRQTALQQAHSSADMAQVEEHFRAIKASYHTTINRIEQENQSLKGEIKRLKEEINEMKQRFDEQLQSARSEKNASSRENSVRAQQRAEDESRRQIQAMQERLDSTVQRYEERLKLVNTQKARLEDHLHSHLHSRYPRPPLVGSESLHLDLGSESSSVYNSEVKDNLLLQESAHSPLHREQRELSDAYSPMSKDSGRYSPNINSPISKDSHSPLYQRKGPSFRSRDQEHKETNGRPVYSDKTQRPSYSENRLLDNSSDNAGQVSDDDRHEGRLTNDQPFHRSTDTILSSQAMSLSDSIDLGRLEILSPLDTVAQKFLDGENKRAKELEMLIDSHIDELKLETNKIVKKCKRRR